MSTETITSSSVCIHLPFTARALTGFKYTFDALDLQHSWPGLFPDWAPPPKSSELDAVHHPHRDTLSPHRPTRLRAALVFMDPLHYHRDLQLLVDVLRSSGVPADDDPTQPVQCHVAGPDLEYVHHLHSIVSTATSQLLISLSHRQLANFNLLTPRADTSPSGRSHASALAYSPTLSPAYSTSLPAASSA